MFGIEFENYDSVKKKLDVLTGQINKGTSGSVKLNIDTEQIVKTISNLSNLAKKEIQILPDGQITVLSKFNAELGKTITLKENLSKKETTIGISDDEEKRLREYTKLFDQAIKQEDTLKKAREDQYKGLFDEAIRQEQQLAKERQSTNDSEWKEMEVVYKQEQAFIEASQKLKQKSSQESLKQIKEEASISNKLLEEKYKEAQSEKDQLENAQKLIAYEKQRLNLKLEGIKANRKDLVSSNDTDSISNNINNLKGNNVSEVREKVRQLNLEMQKLDQTAKMKGLQVGNKNIMSLGESIKSTATKLGIFVSTAMVLNQVQNTIRNATEYIIELDKSMIDLKKVTDETSETYDRFLNKMHNVALELGTQSNLMVDATTNWAKTGKNLEEASKLAENTILLSKIGDVENVQLAQTYMLPALKAFNIEAEDSINLINEYNNISNNMATTVNDVGDAMSKSASSMSVAGNSLEQTIALIATADSATQLGGAEIGTA